MYACCTANDIRTTAWHMSEHGETASGVQMKYGRFV